MEIAIECARAMRIIFTKLFNQSAKILIILIICVPFFTLGKNSNSTFHINDANQLASCLNRINHGDTIFISGKINLTNSKKIIPPIQIPEGVSIIGQDNAELIYEKYFPENKFSALFILNGPDITIADLTIRGPSGDIKDHDYKRRGSFCAIKVMSRNATIRNCHLFACDKWAIWGYYGEGLKILDNDIEGAAAEGYGYGIFITGIDYQVSNGKIYPEILIRGNYFNHCRVAIDGSGHIKKMIIQGNEFGPSMHYTVVQLHPSNGVRSLSGGGDAIIEENTWISTQKNLAWPAPSDTSKYKINIRNNHFSRAENDNKEPAAVIGARLLSQNKSAWLIDENNFYNSGDENELPFAKIVCSDTSGSIPFTVNFTGKDSRDPREKEITEYRWQFADGDWTGNPKSGENVFYTFTKPGVYEVCLTVKNKSGKYSRPVYQTILVNDPQIKYPFVFCCKDSYEDSTFLNRYLMQAVFDDSIIAWQDDVAGNEGWQRVVIDLDKFGLADGTSHRFALRLRCANPVTDPEHDIPEIMVWLDAAWAGLQGSISPSAGSFEIQKLYPPWNQRFSDSGLNKNGISRFSTVLTSDDSRSGNRSARIRVPYLGKTSKGMWGEFYIPFVVKK